MPQDNNIISVRSNDTRVHRSFSFGWLQRVPRRVPAGWPGCKSSKRATVGQRWRPMNLKVWLKQLRYFCVLAFFDRAKDPQDHGAILLFSTASRWLKGLCYQIAIHSGDSHSQSNYQKRRQAVTSY